jgi:hypothetical protein
MLLRLNESVFDGAFPDENGDIFRVYGVIDDIRDFIVRVKNSNLKNSCFRNKILRKKDVFLKIDETEFIVFFDNKEREYKMIKVLCNSEIFWVFDHNFHKI